MKEKELEGSNLVNARSSIVWILAILLSFGAVWWIEQQSGRELIAKTQAPAKAAAIQYTSDALKLPGPRALTAQELDWARIAWAYFAQNTDPSTGLAHSVAAFPSGSLWDEGSYLMALLSAHRLAIIDRAEFDARLARVLASLAKLPLVAGLPNKAYDVHSLAMTDYRNQPAPKGIGVSAIDVARMAVPLQAIAWRHPRHTDAVRALLSRWDLAALARQGELTGWTLGREGTPQPVQEGRLGYEQYAARALEPLRVPVAESMQWTPHLKWVTVAGVQVPADSRADAIDAVSSEPFILEGLEFGWSRTSREMAWRVYRAQEARHAQGGQLTALTEDHLDRAPYFAYGAVYARGREWTAVASDGGEIPALRTLSVKAAFGWHALLGTEYTRKLVDKVAGLHDPKRGWFAGIYEEDGQPNRSLNCNTNAVVLESLAYIAGGPVGGWK